MQKINTYHQSETDEEKKAIDASKSNPQAFSVLYNKYYKSIFNYTYQRLNAKDEAFDVASLVFLKALTNIPKYQHKGYPFSSWLFRIAHNELMQYFREKKTTRAVNADVSDLKHLCEENEEPFFEEYIPTLKKIILELGPDDLQMVEFRYFEKRPFKEIADILDITEVNAKVRMHRVIEKLKSKIKKIKPE